MKGLDTKKNYHIATKPQRLYLERFGGLARHVLPVKLNPDGLILRTANKVYALQDCVEEYQGSGAMLESGILLNNQFVGTGYDEEIRVLGDFGSNLYVTKEEKE